VRHDKGPEPVFTGFCCDIAKVIGGIRMTKLVTICVINPAVRYRLMNRLCLLNKPAQRKSNCTAKAAIGD